MFEVLMGIVSTAALGVGGWAAMQVIKVPSLEEKVDHLVQRVDAIYLHLLDRNGPNQG
jgi:hypothetical protein